MRVRVSIVILSIFIYIFNKKTWYKVMFGLVKKMFIGLITNKENARNHTNH